jgi:HD superfamily phosphohydrolase YqeK
MIEKIVFIADKISAERDYDGVERFRALSKVDLDASVREFRKIIGGKQK